MTAECSSQCADPRVTLDSSEHLSARHTRYTYGVPDRETPVLGDLEMPFDLQGCPGNNPSDPTVGDFTCEQVNGRPPVRYTPTACARARVCVA